jgi:superfamily II DNA or RNA helicase
MNDRLFAFDPRSVATTVPDATYQRGLALYRNQQVLDFELAAMGPQAWDVRGDVVGSSGRDIYQVELTLEITSQGTVSFFSSQCSCPVGRQCKHAVGLALKAGYKSGTVRAAAAERPHGAANPTAEPPTPGERELRHAQRKVSEWLDLFGDAEPSDTNATGRPGNTRAASSDQLVFMLRPVTKGPLNLLQLEHGRSRLLLNGRWAKVRQPTGYFDPRGVEAKDLDIVHLIQSMAAGASYYSTYNSHGSVLTGAGGILALQLAAATGRLFTVSAERMLDKPLAWGLPRAISWHWNEAASTASPEPLWTLGSRLADAGDDAQWFSNNPPLYLDRGTGLCGPVEMAGLSAEHLSLLLKAPPIPQSDFARHETTLLRRFAGLPLPPVLKPPLVVQGIAPTAHLRLLPVPAGDRAVFGLLRGLLSFDYGGHALDATHERNPILLGTSAEHDPASAAANAPRVLLHRDLCAEQSAFRALANLGLANDGHGRLHLLPSTVSQQRWLQWADAQFAPLRETGVVLHLAPSLDAWITRADAFEVRLAPQTGAGAEDDHAGDGDSRSPWFDLSLGFELNGRRHNILPLLPTLLNQLGLKEERAQSDTAELPTWVYLPQADGTYLRLPTAPLRPWLQALLELVAERNLDADTLRLSRLEALRLGAALGDGATWQGAESLGRMVRQLGGHSALPEVALPPGLKAELRPYQQHGLQWLQFLSRHGLAGILADDMGLGKTLQTLSHLLIEKNSGSLDRPALIIAPVSVLSNWQREAARFTPDLRTLVLHGKDRHEAATDMAGHDVVIAPYSLLQRDRDRWTAQPWHLVVLDEAQNIKNANTHAAQVASGLDTRHRLCLSGTPIENHLGELWSLFHFLMPGFLSNQARFKQLFRTPIEKHGDNERLDQLRRRVTPFMLRRTKGEVATDLPEKQEIVSSVELGDKQANLYETIRLTTEKTVREALSSKGLAKSQIQILDALLKLRQVCCDPRLVPIPAAKKLKQSAKLEQLMDLLPELLSQGRRVLLFSQFTAMLELIEEELAQRGIPWVKLTGQSQKRDQLIERFTSGAAPLFLISLKAGGVGLNLTQADTVIHYDPWWNPAVENQATARAHRIGQTRHVFVYKLVAQGTIEERMLALQKRKAALADSMYRDSATRRQPLFTESDLAELLKPLGA